ncbi:13137_t:CDS:10 [Entrophospora sp. SA101]|nr:13137_t:CDS:10 [Entrophospora sp. SA101]
MDYPEEEYNSVVWDTGALKPDELSEEEDNVATMTTGTTTETPFVTTDLSESISSNIDENMFSVSTLAPSPINNSFQSGFINQNNSFQSEFINQTNSTQSLSPNINIPIAFPMTITVTDPKKELDGTKDAFMLYTITTKTTLETFTASTVNIKRRFQDFVLLHTFLSNDFHACVVPPLPDKHRMEYITGDRFSDEFVEKRRASLQRFLERLARHPNAESLSIQKKAAGDGILEHLGDALINAFSRMKKPDERFEELKENIDKLEENLQTVERLYQKIIKRQTDLEADYREFGSTVSGLGQLETGLTSHLENFGETSSKFADAWKELNVLKLRDQKQVDFEALSEYLQNAKLELDSFVTTGKVSTSISSYMRERIDNFKGVDQGDKRERLKTKIAELEKEVENSNDESNKFSNQVIKEYEV